MFFKVGLIRSEIKSRLLGAGVRGEKVLEMYFLGQECYFRYFVTDECGRLISGEFAYSSELLTL